MSVYCNTVKKTRTRTRMYILLYCIDTVYYTANKLSQLRINLHFMQLFIIIEFLYSNKNSNQI